MGGGETVACRGFGGGDKLAANAARLKLWIDAEQAEIGEIIAAAGDVDAAQRRIAVERDQQAAVAAEQRAEGFEVGAFTGDKVGLMRPARTRAVAAVSAFDDGVQVWEISLGSRTDRHHWPLQRRLDLARGEVGVDGLGDRAADDEDRCASVERGAWGNDALLVADLAIGRAHAGDHEEAVLPRIVRGLHFFARADDAVDASGFRQFGEANDLLMRIGRKADRGQVVCVEAGEHRHCDDLGARGRGCLGILKHRAAARGVDGDDRGFERTQRLHRLADSIGNVVELEIQKDRQADIGHLVNALSAVRHEEFKAQLDPADMVADALGDGLGALQVGGVERNVD
eukprot:Opistho-1_new@84769